MLKKGDQCYVRMPDGSIAEAIYNCKANHFYKSHFVDVKEMQFSFSLLAQAGKPNKVDYDECRFVCMTGIKRKDNEKQS